MRCRRFLALCSAADLKPLDCDWRRTPPETLEKLVSESKGHKSMVRLHAVGGGERQRRKVKKEKGREKEKRVGVWMILGRKRERYSGE